MENVRRVDVLESTEDLVEEVADVVIAEFLCLEQLVEVSFHQALHNVPGANDKHDAAPGTTATTTTTGSTTTTTTTTTILCCHS